MFNFEKSLRTQTWEPNAGKKKEHKRRKIRCRYCIRTFQFVLLYQNEHLTCNDSKNQIHCNQCSFLIEISKLQWLGINIVFSLSLS